MSKHHKIHPCTCELCKKSFMSTKKGRKFCGKSCSRKAMWIAFTPENRERYAQRMRMMRQDPRALAKIQSHLASSNNPFRNGSAQRASQAVLRTKPIHPLNQFKGGNGRPLPLPQQLLAETLDWPTEVVVSVNPRLPRYPTNYKIDIAHPSLRIAIEVDGLGHMTQKAKAKDAKKHVFLESKGWKVFRFTNKEIQDNLCNVVNRIRTYERSLT